ncbi:MAG: hypothetical protein WA905_05515 [Pseudolabrys sp.]
MLRAEYEAIQGGVLPKTNFEAAHRNDVQEKKQTALCLSGGGIPSAAFSLGVLRIVNRRSRRIFELLCPNGRLLI